MSKKIFIVLLGLSVLAGFAFSEGQKESSEEAKEITFTVMASGTYDKAAEEVKDAFYEETGIEVTIAAFPWATLRQNNTTDLLTANGKYDVMSGSYYLADIYSHFISLDPYINEYDFGEGLLPGLMDKCEYFNGHQIGLPYGPDAYGLLYRKDVFEKANLTWPNTWDGFIDMLPEMDRVAKENNMDTIVFSGGAPEQNPALFFDKYDGYFISDEGKFELEREKAIETLEMNQELLQYMASDFLGLSIDDANARFLGGDALVLICWPSFVVAAADNPDKSEVVEKWELGVTPKPGRPWLSLWQMYISEYSEAPEAAFKWAQFLLSEKNDKQFYLKYGISPIYESTYEDPEILEEHAHQFTAQMQNLERAFNPPLSGEAQDYFASVLGEFFLGDISPQEFVAKINNRWKDLNVPSAILENAKKTGQTE